MKKIIKECTWDEVKLIEEKNIMRNPALNVKLINGTEIHLDKRKCIVKAIEMHKEIVLFNNKK